MRPFLSLWAAYLFSEAKFICQQSGITNLMLGTLLDSYSFQAFSMNRHQSLHCRAVEVLCWVSHFLDRDQRSTRKVKTDTILYIDVRYSKS